MHTSTSSPTATSNQDSSPIRLLFAGIGGYAGEYLDVLVHTPGIIIAAVIDPMAENSRHWPWLQSMGVQRVESIEEFARSGGQADLAIICSPIAFHADQTCAALCAGMHVLCEKPIGATPADALRMQQAAESSDRFLEIGYQWSFSAPIQQLKSDILTGKFGALLELSTQVRWPRSEAYYTRNNWAGKIRDERGNPIHDSPVNNATAHFLHNMLFLAGSDQASSASPRSISAECYRGNRIENYDTCCCRIDTHEGPRIHFYTTHCVDEQVGPIIRVEFEHAVVEYQNSSPIVATCDDGRRHFYGNPVLSPMDKLWTCLNRCRLPSTPPPVCGARAATPHALCVDKLKEVAITSFPAEQLQIKAHAQGSPLTVMPGLGEAFERAFTQKKLLSELGIPWAAPACELHF
ncbi:MAG: Gfo/Idh/MocA family protein [Puniceicoccales bacterium]